MVYTRALGGRGAPAHTDHSPYAPVSTGGRHARPTFVTPGPVNFSQLLPVDYKSSSLTCDAQRRPVALRRCSVRAVPCGVRAGDRVHACGFVVHTHGLMHVVRLTHRTHTRMIKKRSTRALYTPSGLVSRTSGGLPRLPGAMHAYEDDVTVCVAGSVNEASTRIKEGGGAW